MPPSSPDSPKGSAFWLSFIAVIVANFLSALDMTAVSTAVPKMTNDLHGGDDFVWVGSAYGLASTAILPFSGRLADVFGRRPIMLTSIIIFLVGSALAGAAQTMSWLIAARTVQGIGGGAILNLGSIILSDLVSLAERGTYQGILILVWALAGAIGPTIAGSFAQDATWRWLFYLNLPLAGIAFVLVAVFLRVKTPEGSMRDKLARVDWLGNLIIISGTTLALLALTWGGIRFPWNSSHVLAPLILGIALMLGFFVFEKLVPLEPTTPLDVLQNRTALSGYIATFFHGIVTMSTMFYLPVYFQACFGSSPIHSSVNMLATTLICAPVSLFAGGIVKKVAKYRGANYAGWVLMVIGFGLFTLFKYNSSTGMWAGFQVITAAGIGIIWSATVFPILASIPVHRFAAALAFQNFLRQFAQTWGITISASILQNELKKHLPPAFAAQFPQGVEIAYALIPIIPTLEDPLRTEVRIAFATSMSVVWKAMLGISAGGLLTTFLLKEIPMHTAKDNRYGLESSDSDLVGPADAEKGHK
ncbi:MFS general substrate transporter [Ganoderma sinense ZZ0214-1]|uniref:MFS general substrate transporter n=1 Tax=Ganoderma sinense ZZ0214-1 TaxID=1077348 RepID=A0A2G8SF73_9APHY|nr:MFS general substrate transporter [Ganoderma sinense ZZ0214-1]